MFKSRVALVALAAALLSIFAAPAANAAYAPPPFTADSPGTVGPGEEFTVTFDAGTINCAWALSPFNGQTAAAGSGSTYTVTLTAPEEDGTYTVTANCTWDPAPVGPTNAPISNPVAATSNPAVVTPAVYSTSAVASDTLLAVPQTDSYSVQIRVGEDAGSAGDNAADDEGDENGALPDTGGSNLSLLAIGAGLVVVGAGVTVAARRRKNS
jgi:LPXTG-motif cell wall-anchored protein